jgi:energy-converting hydrogenase Eha subunit C
MHQYCNIAIAADLCSPIMVHMLHVTVARGIQQLKTSIVVHSA